MFSYSNIPSAASQCRDLTSRIQTLIEQFGHEDSSIAEFHNTYDEAMLLYHQHTYDFRQASSQEMNSPTWQTEARGHEDANMEIQLLARKISYKISEKACFALPTNISNTLHASRIAQKGLHLTVLGRVIWLLNYVNW
jgi:hypothetical protein